MKFKYIEKDDHENYGYDERLQLEIAHQLKRIADKLEESLKI